MSGALDPALDFALREADNGVPVFPVGPDKIPLIKGWPDLATTDPDQIRRWAKQFPDCNFGGLTGERAGRLIIEVDPRNGGDETIRILEDRFGPLDETRMYRSGSGGPHYVLAWPEGHHIKSAAGKIGKHDAPGVDVKGHNSYGVLPGSLHKSGNRYELINDILPRTLSPRWLAEIAVQESEPIEAPAEGDATLSDGQRETIRAVLVPHWTDGQRHDVSRFAAGWLATHGVAESETRALISEFCDLANDPEKAARLVNVETTYELLREGKHPEGWAGLQGILSAEDLQRLNTVFPMARPIIGGKPTSEPKPADPDYRVNGGHFEHVRRLKEVDVWTPVCNFEARIEREERHDDGEHVTSVFAISGSNDQGHRFPEIEVPATEYPRMEWPLNNWGTRARIEAGRAAADHTRAAIQTLSDPKHITVYTHPGWRNLPGFGMCYLSADQVIGADGPVDGVTVRLEGTATNIALPAPPATKAEQANAVRLATERFLSLGPDRLTIPLFAAAIRAAFCASNPADFAVWLTGPTNSFKTEIAAALARFYGPGFDRLGLPSFLSTPNYLERAAFTFKDAAFIVDDYAPGGDQRSANELRGKAERIVRGAGNAQGRGRLRRDGKPMITYQPRGLAIVTGEDVSGGHSRTARTVTLEVNRGDIGTTALSELQTAEGRALPSLAMATFLQDMAGRYDEATAAFSELTTTYRGKLATDGALARTPAQLAQLGAAFWCWVDFGRRCGAFDEATTKALLSRAVDAILENVRDQINHAAEEDPARKFIESLFAGMRAGAFHVNDAMNTEEAPDDLGRWGWKTRQSENNGFGSTTEKQSLGLLIGYVDLPNHELWIEPAAAIKAVRQFDQTAAPHTERTTGRNLSTGGYLVREGSRETTKARRSVNGRQESFWVINLRKLNGGDDDAFPE